MTPERAQEIVTAINNQALYSMGVYGPDRLAPLEGISLADMIEAKRIVEEGNKTREGPGPHTIHCVPDDRLIAAAYVLQHYPSSEEAVLYVPEARRMFSDSHTHRALAVVAFTPGQEEEAA